MIRCCIDKRLPPRDLPPGVEALAADADLFWPNGSTLRVAFLDGDSTAHARWFACAAEWSKYANIDFAPATSSTYDLLVSFDPRGGGYYSYLGTSARQIPRGTPTMVLAGLDRESDDEFRRVALHEIGHALGCIHEHQSPAAGIPWNREAVYQWYQQTQGWTRAEIDDQVFNRYAAPHTQYTQWDKYSIMEYPIDAALVTDPSFAVGWNKELTATDKVFIAKCYPGRSVVSPPPVQPPTPPVQPPIQPPANPTTLVVDEPPSLCSLAVNARLRLNLRVYQAASYRIETFGASKTTVVLGQLSPRPKVIRRSAGRKNGLVIAWLTRGDYVVDVVPTKSPTGPAVFTVGARRIGRV